ncbi:MAG: alanine racemase [Pseudomonadota bacterium]|nr:alanine racemase [Pseudomonadota bacterium]MDE3037828.1 alanine racemase [Pseudomonadota bacterium]
MTVDLGAVRANWRLLKDRHAKKSIAAVVKANAYGLGVEAVSRALWDEGCREFFVATLEEGIELRGILPDAAIAVFSGVFAGEEKEYAAHRLVPVINDAGQLAAASGQRSVILHIDTGITRLGLSESEAKKLSADWPLITGRCRLIMSHLACSSEPAHPKNAEQLARFRQTLARFPGARASVCNSAGLFLPPEFHFDLGRPGCALYGINPTPGKNPMQHVATLSAPILQIRTLDRDETVGYGATCQVKKGSRIAILALGYADGYFRSQSNKGAAFINGRKVPIIGRVSMDMIALDVSAAAGVTPDMRAEFINAEQTVDDVAGQCGTIGYEIFTRIGERVKRVYHS